MSCKSCKEKNAFREELSDSTKYVEKSAIVFFIIWSGFALYGIYSFVKLFI